MTTVDELVQEAAEFERTLRRRNTREVAAAAVVIVIFAVYAVIAESISQRLTALAVIAAAGFVGTFVMLVARPRLRAEPQSLRDVYRNEVVRQARLNRWVPLWYTGPINAALIAFFAVRRAPALGIGLILLLAVMNVVSNQRAARALELRAECAPM